MKLIMAGAVDAKLIRDSPCYNVRLPRIELEEKRFLTVPEVARLADAMPDRHRALVLLCCWGGLRIREATGLNRRHVDGAKVTVVQSAGEVRGKLSVGPLKTPTSRRRIVLPGVVGEALAVHLRDFTEAEPDSSVFCNPDGSRIRANGFRKRVWAPAVAKAGLAPLRIHDMRHTAVALWIATGVPALQVRKYAGHASVSFTLNQYGHLFDDTEDALFSGLDSLITSTAIASSKTDNVVPLRRSS